MTNQINIFLQKIQGQWMSQKTIYYTDNIHLHSYPIKNCKQASQNTYIMHSSAQTMNEMYSLTNININTNAKTSYIFERKNYKGNLQKVNTTSAYNGIFEFYAKNCIKMIFKHNSISYIEYIYLITQNFKLSISIIKIKERYIVATFTSYIKKIIA